jgi:hypothetical protein
MTLVRVACLRWPVEEGFEFAKDHFGLDHSQVRLYTAHLRHIVLTMAALAVCAVTAAHAKTRAPVPILPHHGRRATTTRSRPDRADRGRDQTAVHPGNPATPAAGSPPGLDLVATGATKPEHTGVTTAPDSADKPPQHEVITVRLPY